MTSRAGVRLALAGPFLGVIGLALVLVALWPSAPGETILAAAPRDADTDAIPADAGRGAALFLAKGCATCHHHAAIATSREGVKGAPNLTHYVANAAFLRRWLHDPVAVRPATAMPNLQLQPDEIEALIAFLQADRQRASS